MNNFDEVKEMLYKINFPILMDIQECIWSINGDEVCWNTDNNFSDLIDGDGNSYSADIVEGYHEQGDYTVMNIDSGMGYNLTMFFRNCCKVKL